jgi:hypothetical protein
VPPQPFDYVASLANPDLPADDEDYEWCAQFIVLADSADAAAAWGDKIAQNFCSASSDVFLRSSVEPHVCSMTITAGDKHPCPNFPALSRAGNKMMAMPVVAYGDPATPEYIGW